MNNNYPDKFNPAPCKKYVIYLTLFSLFFFIALSQSNSQTVKLNKTRFDFGPTKFMQQKCDRLVIRNILDIPINFISVDSILIPFSGNITYPHTLLKGDSLVFQVCYQAIHPERDSQHVQLKVGYRLSQSIALLFDRSGSMDERLPWPDLSKKIEAAEAAGIAFIDSMQYNSMVMDEAAIFSFSDYFLNDQNFTSNKDLLKKAIPKSADGDTHLYTSIYQTIEQLRTRKFQKTLIVLTDGKNSNAFESYDYVVKYAIANKVTIFTVGIGTDDVIDEPVLKDIANRTGGKFFQTTTRQGLIDIYSRIFGQLNTEEYAYFDLLGGPVIPDISISCPDKIGIEPGDIISYNIYMINADYNSYQNKKYKIRLKFNRNLIEPINKNLNYGKDSSLEITGIYSSNSNSNSQPLANIAFNTFLVDSQCTDVRLESLEWVETSLPVINSDSYCRTCMDVCVFNLRQISTMNILDISGIDPNPLNDRGIINYEVPEPGYYKMELYNLSSSRVKTLVEGYFQTGKYTAPVEVNDIAAGCYACVLKSQKKTVSKMIIVR